MKSLFSRLDYPHHLTNSAIKQQRLQASGRLAGNDVTRVVIPFKDQDSANIVKKQLKDLIVKLQTTIQPVFVNMKLAKRSNVRSNRSWLINSA